MATRNGQYTIQKDGYIYAIAIGIQGREQIFLNNTRILIGGDTEGAWFSDSTFMPVKKGTVIKVQGEIFNTYATHDAYANIWFMPK